MAASRSRSRPAHTIYSPPSNEIAWLFERGYPFEAWRHRVRRLKYHAFRRRLRYQAAETLLYLLDTYATVLTTSLKNPSFRWLAAERFATTGVIRAVAGIFAQKLPDRIWKTLMEDPRFVSLEGYEKSDEDPAALLSLLVGNPGRKTRDGVLELTHNPELLVAVVTEALGFWSAKRPLLNAMKHGYRLPQFHRDQFGILLKSQSESGRELGGETDPKVVVKTMKTLPFAPVFWLLDSEGKRPRDPAKGPTTIAARVSLYGIDYRRTIEHCELLLDLLSLQFDQTRGKVKRRRLESLDCGLSFRDLLECIGWIPYRLNRDDSLAARTVGMFAPDDRNAEESSDLRS